MTRMTNKEFGKRVGIGYSYASYLRSGSRKPSGDLLIKIILEFELDPIQAMTKCSEGAESFGAYLRETVFSEKENAEHATP